MNNMSQPIDSIDPVTDLAQSLGRRLNISDTVFRSIRVDEDPIEGLVAKDPTASRSLTSQVLCGSRGNYKSQYISTTKSLEVIKKYGAPSNRVVKIDTGICIRNGCRVDDISDGRGLNGPRAKNYAIRSKEVLISGCVIPPEAIEEMARSV